MRIQKEFFDEEVYIPIEDVKQMLRELGLEQFYQKGSDTSPPIRITHETVAKAIKEIYQEDE